MSTNYMIIIIYGYINMIAKYMPNLKKVSGFEDKSIFKYSSAMMDISSSQKMRCVLWNYVFGHFKRCGIE